MVLRLPGALMDKGEGNNEGYSRGHEQGWHTRC